MKVGLFCSFSIVSLQNSKKDFGFGTRFARSNTNGSQLETRRFENSNNEYADLDQWLQGEGRPGEGERQL